MAYTKEENGQPAKYLGIIQARDRTEPFSIREQKAKSKRITRESKQLDRASIYSERLDRQQAVENKKKQSLKASFKCWSATRFKKTCQGNSQVLPSSITDCR